MTYLPPPCLLNVNCVAVDSAGMSAEGAILFDLLSCFDVQKGGSERGGREANSNVSKGEKAGRLFNIIREAPNSVQFLFPVVCILRTYLLPFNEKKSYGCLLLQ